MYYDMKSIIGSLYIAFRMITQMTQNRVPNEVSRDVTLLLKLDDITVQKYIILQLKFSYIHSLLLNLIISMLR